MTPRIDEKRVDAGGLNRAEASFLAAMLRFGGDADLIDAVESGPARALRARLEAVAPLGDRARRQCARDLTELARPIEGPERLPLALGADSEEHFDVIRQLDGEALRELGGDFGAFQLAELLRDKNRRKIARVARRFGRRRRPVFLRALRRDRDCERRERIRIREVFVSFSRRVDAFDERVEHLGLYSIACAAGLRYRERIAELVDRLPPELGERMRRYYRLSYRSTRRGVGRRFRGALEQFLSMCDDETGGDRG